MTLTRPRAEVTVRFLVVVTARGGMSTPNGWNVNEEDRQQLDTRLRALCSRRQLDWIVAQIDQLIAEGNLLKAVSRQEYPAFSQYAYPIGRKVPRPKPAELTPVPFTPTERTIMQIDAFIAVFDQLPKIQVEVLHRLATGHQGRVGPVHSIMFMSSPDTVELAVDRAEAIDYAAVLEALHAARDAVTRSGGEPQRDSTS